MWLLEEEYYKRFFLFNNPHSIRDNVVQHNIMVHSDVLFIVSDKANLVKSDNTRINKELHFRPRTLNG